MAASMKKPPVSFTLPIACQICLGKVKEPVICSNQHVFCNTCMEVWLQHQSHCPTCRIPITTESPCKQILGGPSFSEDSHKRRSNSELRKIRFEMMHREYEAEIETLQAEVDRLRAKNSQLQRLKSVEDGHPSSSSSNPISTSEPADLKRSQDNTISREGSSSHSHQENFTLDNFILLTHKLKKTNSAYQKLKTEMEKVKQDNDQLRDHNAGYLREIGRLKQSLTCRSPRKYEKYAQAAQQAKLDKSEQEVKQLKRALERSDVYVEELECKVERYEQAHGPLEPRSNHSLTLHSSSDDKSGSSVKTSGLDIGEMADSATKEGDPVTVHSFKMESSEPTARKFYSTVRDPLAESPPTSTVSRAMTLSPDLGLNSMLPGSSRGVSDRADAALSDGWGGPSTSYGSSTTPSSKFSSLRLSSDTKTSEVGNESTEDASVSANRDASSLWISSKKSPRRQLQFDSRNNEPSTDPPKIPSCVPSSAAIAFAENSGRGNQRDALVRGGRSPEKRKLDDTQNDTLNELDYTLTEEFVDCAKLLKAAERRIRQKSSVKSDAGNGGPSSSGSGS